MDSTLDVVIAEKLKRKRGRPKGTKNGKRETEKWQPQKWKPEYEKILALDLLGTFTQKMIADTLGVTSAHVNQVLNCDEAIARKEKAVGKLRTEFTDKIPERLNALALRSLDNMQYVLESDDIRENNPIAIFDRSERVLQSIGKMARPIDTSKGNVNNVQNNFIIPPEQARTFLSGLKLAEQYQEQDTLLLAEKID